MSYAERAYFDGEPVAHCGTREESQRLARIAKANAAALRSFDRRRGSRARHLAA